MKTNLEKALIKTKKDIDSMFEYFIDSYEVHIKYIKDNKTDIKKIKDNTKECTKLRTSISNSAFKILALYAPTSIKLVETSIYLKANIHLAEIIRKNKEILHNTSNDFSSLIVEKKELISIEENTIKVFKKTAFMITNLLNEEKIKSYYKDISSEVKDNTKKYEAIIKTITKKAKERKPVNCELDNLLYLKAILDVECQCLYIASSINKNSHKL